MKDGGRESVCVFVENTSMSVFTQGIEASKSAAEKFQNTISHTVRGKLRQTASEWLLITSPLQNCEEKYYKHTLSDTKENAMTQVEVWQLKC